MNVPFAAALLVLLAPFPAAAQFDEPDPVFAVEKTDDKAEVKQEYAVDVTDELRPMMNVELGFIKRVCKPTGEQKELIAKAASVCITRLNEIASANQAEQEGGLAAGREIVAVTSSGVQLTENPIDRIQRDMAAALRPILSAEQHAAYVDEVAQRRQFKRQGVIAVTVVLLDQQLILTDEQRRKLTSRLLDEWTEAESIPITMYVSNHQYFPELPESVIQTELNAAQRAVWKSLNKTRFPLYLGLFGMVDWEEDFLE